MANYYVRSAAAGAGDGSTWADAFTTITLALSGKAAGDVFWIADDHAESTAGAVTLTSPGTAGLPCRIICVNTHATEPPTAKATSATVTATGTVNLSFAAGFAYCYGITFNCGTGSSTVVLQWSTTAAGWEMEACKFSVLSSGASSRINVGNSTAGAAQIQVTWRNCTVRFTGVAQGISLRGARFCWWNTATAVDAAGTIPTTLLLPGNQYGGQAEIAGVDLVVIDSGNNLVDGTQAVPHRILVRNCKLGSSFTTMTGTIVGPGGTEVYVENCDSGDTNYKMEHYKYQGSIKQEIVIVRTSGASDGTTPISHKMVTLATGPTLFSPLEGPWMAAWCDSTGAKTVTVEIVHDSVTALTDAQVWLEVEYLGDGSFPLSAFANDRVADHFATPADQTASVIAWTTTGITDVNKQKLAVAFTVAEKGPIRARVMLALASKTVYVDPLLTVS